MSSPCCARAGARGGGGAVHRRAVTGIGRANRRREWVRPAAPALRSARPPPDFPRFYWLPGRACRTTPPRATRLCAAVCPHAAAREGCPWSLILEAGPHGAAVLSGAAAVADGKRQILRRFFADEVIEIGEMEAVQTFEVAYGLGRVVIAKPPAPVGTFAGGELLFRRRKRRAAQPAGAHRAVEREFGVTQHVPGAILVLVADPGGKGAEHPAAGDQARQPGAALMLRKIIRKGGELDARMRHQLFVERTQKIITVVGIVFPRVFAVEDDWHEIRLAVIDGGGDVLELLHEIIGGVVAVPGGVLETDQIGERIVAKKTGDVTAAFELEGPVQRLLVLVAEFDTGRVQGIAQHAAAARGPAETIFTEQFESGIAHAAFRRPAAVRAKTEVAFEAGHALFDMPARALVAARVGAQTWPRRLRHGLAGAAEVAQQRHDGMGIRIHGKIDLPALR